MRVLALTHVFPRHAQDAAAPFLLAWAQGLQRAGSRVVVVAPHDRGLPARHRVDGVPVRRVRYAPDRCERIAYRGEMHALVRSAGGPALLGGLVAAMVVAVADLERAGQPDLVHVHWWLPGAVIARAARVKAPLVVTVHGTDVALLESRPSLAPLARWALAAVDRVEAVSVDLAERLERATGRRVDAVNPMPLATQPPSDRPARAGGPPLQVLGVGRLVADKGFADLVDAVAVMRAPVRLTLIGEGPERSRLAARAAAAGVELLLLGTLTPAALSEHYASADVVTQPSHREGFGLVAAEALVAGVPVVATDSGGARDVLGGQGLVAVGDIKGLAHALDRVAADPATAASDARARGQALRARLTPEACATRTLAGYRTLGRSGDAGG